MIYLLDYFSSYFPSLSPWPVQELLLHKNFADNMQFANPRLSSICPVSLTMSEDLLLRLTETEEVGEPKVKSFGSLTRV